MSPAAPRLEPGMVVQHAGRSSAEQPQPAEKKEGVPEETRTETLPKRDSDIHSLATGVKLNGNEPTDGVGVSAGASDDASDSEATESDSGGLADRDRLQTTEAGISSLSLAGDLFCINCAQHCEKKGLACSECGEPWDGSNGAPYVAAAKVFGVEAGIGSYGPGGEESRTAIGYHSLMLKHEKKRKFSDFDPHPERSDRLLWIMGKLKVEGLLERCRFFHSRKATLDELKTVHTEKLINNIESLKTPENVTEMEKARVVMSDSFANEHTGRAARLAAGTCAGMAMDIMNGRYQNGFAVVRPPGHHATSGKSQGFCFYNNVAVATRAAQKQGAKKVLILDWDVHHGNGTQDIFWNDPTVLFISLHRACAHFYPETGNAREVGQGPGAGFSVNVPWPHKGVGDDDYNFAFQHIVMPIAQEFAPDITIVSAGFDAAAGDPLGGCKVTPTCFAQMTQLLSSLSGGKILLVLEGGYNLHSISNAAVAVVKVLLGDCPVPVPETLKPSLAGKHTVHDVIQTQLAYWPNLRTPACCEGLPPLDLKTGLSRPRKVLGGPRWWLWGRKRLVFHHWFAHADLPYRCR